MTKEKVVNEIESLVKNLIKLYKDRQREKTEKGSRVFRGRSKTVASDFEDHFAKFLERISSSNFKFLVDQHIYHHGDKKSLYPDITIVKGNCLVGVFELKMDLGYLPEGWDSKSEKKYSSLFNSKNVFIKTRYLDNSEIKDIPNFKRWKDKNFREAFKFIKYDRPNLNKRDLICDINKRIKGREFREKLLNASLKLENANGEEVFVWQSLLDPKGAFRVVIVVSSNNHPEN